MQKSPLGRLQKASKLVSYWLRHNPSDAGLTIDECGWASVTTLLAALRGRGYEITPAGLQALNAQADKVRWEIDLAADRIRATHGHSFPVLLDDKAKAPPTILYHGTALKSLESIAAQGLRPMRRQFVHLA